MKKIILAIFSIVLFAGSINAQSNKGYIKQEITEVTSEDEQMAMMLEMMKGTQTEYFYSGDKMASKASMMGGMVETKSMLDKATGTMTMLIDAMGQKMYVESSEKEMNEMNKDQAEMMSKMEITYDESDTKVIAGVKCFKANIKSPDMAKGTTFSMYVSPEVLADNKLIQGMQFFELKGFPMEFVMDAAGQMKMTFTTIEYKTEVDESVFEMSTDGYTKKTFKELMEMSGGMGF